MCESKQSSQVWFDLQLASCFTQWSSPYWQARTISKTVTQLRNAAASSYPLSAAIYFAFPVESKWIPGKSGYLQPLCHASSSVLPHKNCRDDPQKFLLLPYRVLLLRTEDEQLHSLK